MSYFKECAIITNYLHFSDLSDLKCSLVIGKPSKMTSGQVPDTAYIRHLGYAVLPSTSVHKLVLYTSAGDVLSLDIVWTLLRSMKNSAIAAIPCHVGFSCIPWILDRLKSVACSSCPSHQVSDCKKSMEIGSVGVKFGFDPKKNPGSEYHIIHIVPPRPIVGIHLPKSHANPSPKPRSTRTFRNQSKVECQYMYVSEFHLWFG